MVIGLMSGTSLDGLDVALCRLQGSGSNTAIELLQFETIAYDPFFQQEVRSVFAKRQVDLEKVCLLHTWIAAQHAHMILGCLQRWQIDPKAVDMIASHGQTIYHAPKTLHPNDAFGNATLQIGDGDHIAVLTGILTISDFRQKHVAAGGEGAPLAAYGDYLIFSKQGENRVMLNIGGIANFTYLPGSCDAREVFSTDVGPGNTLMDAYIQKHFPGNNFDKDAAIALQGQVNEALLYALMQHAFFAKGFPKTTGPELFNLAYLEEAMQNSEQQDISPYDVMATLNRFTATGIIEALRRIPEQAITLYASGGGMHNPLLMQYIREQLPGYTFRDTNSLYINPDAKEAVLFAVLANECICGGEEVLGDGSNGIPHVTMGKVSFPY
ncbi:anhydro-N-acetylmuramic acid kinase [Russula earlei]|uniref:Anhydro-N-acetylmuramic acid kinase n=1 Tax=Russula earlei TaxID=71964 RepID=A0ACC0TVK7_9AGAM|nr:anhydro-N-acetylmuramic acid kinase [Russula earlei]